VPIGQRRSPVVDYNSEAEGDQPPVESQRNSDAGSKVSLSSVVVASENQISSDVAGEAVILDLKVGVYYGLDAVASRIWHLIQHPRSVSEVRNALLDEYDVDPARCEQDLLMLLRQLEASRLIAIQNE
jgi:hypothetical protein